MPGGPGDGGGGEGAAAWGPNSTDFGRAVAVAQPRHPYLDTIVTSLFERHLAKPTEYAGLRCVIGRNLRRIWTNKKSYAIMGLSRSPYSTGFFYSPPEIRGPTR